ncbi:MAG TPA: hypothetical protein VML19_17960 [Verrucomicrobiae bacterium]|nr:hypothetical protein [Verrucomicrobiae bacterium]
MNGVERKYGRGLGTGKWVWIVGVAGFGVSGLVYGWRARGDCQRIGKINLFALDALVNMATATGMRIEMRVLEAA